MKFIYKKEPDYFGPAEIALIFEKLKFPKRFCKWLDDNIPHQPFDWLYEKRKRPIVVVVEPHDTWGLDHTLAHIIHPCLIQLKATKHGSPYVEDMDVPDHLKSINDPPRKEGDDWSIPDAHHDRWAYVLDEMIWTMGQIKDENNDSSFFEGEIFDSEGHLEHTTRIANGCRLFGKYFQSLWD